MIVMSGVAVNNRSKEELYRKEIEVLRQEISNLSQMLKAKCEEVEFLIEKVHKMGGRIRK